MSGGSEEQAGAPRGLNRGLRRRGPRALALAVAAAALGAVAVTQASAGAHPSAGSGAAGRGGPTARAAAKPGTGKPTVVIGDKNFEEENLLGALYAKALHDQGYKVVLKPNVGSTEIIYKALTSGKIGMYPEYTGTLLSTIAGQTKNPASAKAAYNEAKAYVEKHGLTMLAETPFYDADALAVLPSYAKENHLTSISQLKALGKKVTMGGAPEFQTRYEGLIGLKKAYGVVPSFKPISIELSYKALESGQVNVQEVFTTDGQLLGGKFKVLSDPKHIFGYQNVAPIVSKKVATEEGPAFAQTLNKVSALLTIKAIQQMNAAITIDKQSAAKVADEFLKANGL